MRYWTRYIGLLPQQEHEKDEEPEREAAPLVTQPAARRVRPAGGQPLLPAARSQLERGLDVDLRAVRLHHDPAAAKARGARAYSDGQHIVMADPHDFGALAHEAAHVAQAAHRGVAEGTSTPGSSLEQEAQAASDAVRAGRTAPIAETGAPVPTLMRESKPKESSTDLVVQREAVRLMLQMQYSQQKDGGAFKLTPVLKDQLRRLLPNLDDAAIVALWTPDPAGPLEAYQRLSDAGFLPVFAGAPKPEEEKPQALEPKKEEAEPVAEPKSEGKPKAKLEYTGITGVGFHLVINPRAPAPISAVIRQELANRGLPLSYEQVQTLLAGRKQGIDQIDRILKAFAPGLGREQREKLAATIADVLLTKSVQGQLQREAPTQLERNAEIEAQLDAMLGIPRKSSGGMLNLLEKVPVGVSITIYF